MGRVKTIPMLIEAGIDLDVKSNQGLYAIELMFSEKSIPTGHFEMAQMLVDAGCQIRKNLSYGKAVIPLIRALKENADKRIEVEKAMLDINFSKRVIKSERVLDFLFRKL